MGLMKTCDASISLFSFSISIVSPSEQGSSWLNTTCQGPASKPCARSEPAPPAGRDQCFLLHCSETHISLPCGPSIGRIRDGATARGFRKLRCFQGCGHDPPRPDET